MLPLALTVPPGRAASTWVRARARARARASARARIWVRVEVRAGDGVRG